MPGGVFAQYAYQAQHFINHALGGLGIGGQGTGRLCRHRHIVIANDRDLPTDIPSALMSRDIDGGDRHAVIGAEDRVGPILASQQPSGRRGGGLDPIVARRANRRRHALFGKIGKNACSRCMLVDEPSAPAMCPATSVIDRAAPFLLTRFDHKEQVAPAPDTLTSNYIRASSRESCGNFQGHYTAWAAAY